MIRVGLKHETSNREYAIKYVMSVLENSTDWQEGQSALADHETIGPWLRGTYESNAISVTQSIIREAEERLGDKLPY